MIKVRQIIILDVVAPVPFSELAFEKPDGSDGYKSNTKTNPGKCEREELKMSAEEKKEILDQEKALDEDKVKTVAGGG